MKRFSVHIIIVAVCVPVFFGFGISCGGSRGSQAANFGGSTTLLPVMEGAIETFGKLYPEARISYEAPGSSAGIKGVLDGTYSLGGSSRALKDPEKQAGVDSTAIALDGLAIIVNGKIPVNNLTLEQVAGIFTGKIANWKEVGGPDTAIVVVNRDEASGTRGSFTELVLERALGKDARFVQSALIVESNGDMVQKVGGTPGSVGYCGFGYLEAVKMTGARAASVNGISPDSENVYSGKYPLSRELFVVHKGPVPDKGIEHDFVKFLLSQDGQKTVKESGFLPLP